MSERRLLVFGLGYTARAFVKRLGPEWAVARTTHDGRDGTLRFDRGHPLPDEIFETVTHALVSVPPDEAGDPVCDLHGEDLAALRDLRWVGYLSTTGVYGTRNGDWVDETAELRPTGARSERRAAAEAAWLTLWRQHDVPVHVFRLAGIYGPGRSAFDALRAGTAKRIDAGAQKFSRIHVDDIANVLLASIAKPRPGAIYNVCDDEPAGQAEIVACAAQLLGVEPPRLVPLADADLSPMARSFYADNKRVSNALIKAELGVTLAYPDYRAGLNAILAGGG
ncbi:MAG TPA: NAD-dependent epimerase/dehydratase family protein [Stellaceae bacterium]|nr:NAD-dependent epimerase/dehydratase family protein [Stellaceae bacterium]